jgi:flagella synthesis protein FlgN
MHNLHEQLVRQTQRLENLIQLLENELHLISTRDAETLLTLLKEKETLLEDIEECDTQIQKMYLAAQTEHTVTDEISENIDYCLKLVDQCKYRTDINQTAVENGQLRLEHLRHVLVELRAKESMTYDRSGKAHSNSSTRTIKA